MIIIGIDPGLTGAVAVIFSSTNVAFFDAPTQKVKVGKSEKSELLPAEMAAYLRQVQRQGLCHCFIESVHAMKDQGVTGMFNFGKGFGIWIGILAGLEIPHTFVTPQAWKKALMQGVKDKDAARGRAQQLFPAATSQLSRKKDGGRADALLIAKYGLDSRQIPPGRYGVVFHQGNGKSVLD